MSNGGGLGLAGPARVYDCLLGGKDNYAVDRELVMELLEIEPGLVDAACANRAFVRRAVRELAGLGLRQFLDLGCGLPTTDNVHQIAARHAPGSRVLYVDQDPLVLVHARALLVDDGDVAVVQADLRKPEDLVAQSLDHGLLDPSEPVAVLLTSVLHHLTDADDPWHTIQTLTDALPPGSALVISHLTDAPVTSASPADEPGVPMPRNEPGTPVPASEQGVHVPGNDQGVLVPANSRGAATTPQATGTPHHSEAASTPRRSEVASAPRRSEAAGAPHAPRLVDAPVAGAALTEAPAQAGTPTAVAAAVAARYTEGCSLPLVPRDIPTIMSLLDGLELLAPGFVPVEDWRPEITSGTPSGPSLYLGAAATIPS